MYSRDRWEKLTQEVQTLLCGKGRTFSRVFSEGLECTQNFAYFKTKDQLHSLNISEVIDAAKCVYFSVRKLLL